MLFYKKNYTAGKKFTLPPVVPVVTNLSSLSVCTWLLRRSVQQRGAAQKLPWHSYMSLQYTCKSGLNEHNLRNLFIWSMIWQWHFRRQTSPRTMLDTKKNATFWPQKYCCPQWLLMTILFVQWIVNMLWQNKRPSSPVITANVFLSNATKSHAWETWSHFHVIFCTAKNIQLSQNKFSFFMSYFFLTYFDSYLLDSIMIMVKVSSFW